MTVTLADDINAQLAPLGRAALTIEQLECLDDPARVEEAAAMLDDLQARFGVRVALPEGEELPTAFYDEEEARAEARKQAAHFDAVCVEAMATEGRTRDSDEYYVITFSGPGAALAAASRSQMVAYWVAGQEQ
jgi:hypothetical protein